MTAYDQRAPLTLQTSLAGPEDKLHKQTNIARHRPLSTVHASWFLFLGSWFLVLGSRSLVLSPWSLVDISTFLGAGWATEAGGGRAWRGHL